MAERLGEVAGEPSGVDIVLLGVEAHVVRQPQELGEHVLRFLPPSAQRQGIDHPERARQERTFPAGQPIDLVRFRAGGVAIDEHTMLKVRLHGVHGAADPLIVTGEEPDGGQQQRRRVECGATVVLGECSQVVVPRLGQHFRVHSMPDLPPALDGARQTVLLDGADRPVERDPHHDPGMGEIALGATNFPQAIVRLVPDLLEMPQHAALQRPRLGGLRQAALPCEVQCIHDLAVHVELALPERRIADPHRAGTVVSGQPVGLPFEQMPFPVDAIHDLQIRGISRHGTHQPRAPGRGLFDAPVVVQGQEDERGVAQPAVPVIPVPVPAQHLRQRGRRCGHHATAGCVGQRFQGRQRPVHG